MRTGIGSLLFGMVLLASAAVPGAALADGNADEAELQFQLGADAYQHAVYREALAHFLASNRLVPNRNVRFNIARTYERLSQFADAYRWYQDALDGETDAQIQTTIRDALTRIGPNVAVLDVTTDPPGATIYVDRKDLGSVAVAPRRIALAPRTLRVVAALEGYEDAVADAIVAVTGQMTPVALHLVRIIGHVRVDAETGTTVHVDDEEAPPVCTAPCTFDAAPGVHLLYFRREGFRVVPRQVNVAPGQTADVHTTSTPVTGSIVVNADEREAVVELDGRSVGFTPIVVPNVPVGRRVLRISQRGFSPVERTIDVRENQQTDVGTVHLAAIHEVTSVSQVTESIDDAPSSLSIVTAQELEAFQYPTIGEALRGQRGVALSFDSTYTSIAVRGLGQPNDYGSRLLILQNGSTLNDNLLFQSYTGYDGRVDLGDVDRIEFVRGPGSVLYGAGAESGVVNLVTRPHDEPTSVWVGMSTYEDAVGRARAGFHWNASRDAGIWTSVSGAHSDGVDAFIPAPVGEVARGFDHFDALTLNGHGWWKWLSAQWFLTSRDERIPTGAYGTLFNDPHTRWRDTRALLELRADPQFSSQVGLSLRGTLNHARFGGDYLYDDGTGTGGTTTNRETYAGTWLTGDVRLVLRPVSQLRITAGGEAQTHFEVSFHGNDTLTPDTPYLAEDARYNVVAGYGLVEWVPYPWLRISAGARVDGWLASSTTSFVSVNPRFAVILKPTPSDVVKLMGGRAFRAPTPYQLYYSDGGITEVRSVDLTNLVPETLLSAEVEYSHRFDADWVGLVAAHVQRADLIVDTVQDDMGRIYYANSTTPLLTAGGDVEVRREFRSGLMVAGMLGYLRAVYGDLLACDPTVPPCVGAAPGTPVGQRVPNAPEIFASARGVIPLGDTGVRLAVRLTLEGPRRLVDETRETDPALVADVVLSGRIRQLGLRWAIGAYNLLDWRYSVPVAATFASPIMPQFGRTFMASLDLTY